MTDDELRAANENSKRAARIKSASDPDARRLAEVEQAVIAAHEELEAEESQMRADGKYADGYIAQHIAARRTQSQTYLDKLKIDIVDPIATKIEARAKATAFQVPERTAVHIEASQHYSRLDSDRRQEAISRAITGKDDVLAEALLTGRDEITDITRDHLMRRLSPMTDDKDQIMDMAKRVQSTLNTIKGSKS